MKNAPLQKRKSYVLHVAFNPINSLAVSLPKFLKDIHLCTLPHFVFYLTSYVGLEFRSNVYKLGVHKDSTSSQDSSKNLYNNKPISIFNITQCTAKLLTLNIFYLPDFSSSFSSL